jgi:cell division protease FtsH
LYGMGRSLVSVGAMGPSMFDGDAIGSVLRDGDRRREVDAILDDCRRRVRSLLSEKSSVLEGVRDALLEREELIGDEIEALMASLGERDPIEVEVPILGPLSPTGHLGNGSGDAPGNGAGPS